LKELKLGARGILQEGDTGEEEGGWIKRKFKVIKVSAEESSK